MKKIIFSVIISLQVIPKGTIDNNSAPVQIMVWRVFSAKP